MRKSSKKLVIDTSAPRISGELAESVRLKLGTLFVTREVIVPVYRIRSNSMFRTSDIEPRGEGACDAYERDLNLKFDDSWDEL